MKETAQHGKEAAEAVGGVIKKTIMGSKDAAGNAAGGVWGFVKGIGDAAFSLANGTASIAFKTVKKFPILATAAAVIGGAIGVKKFLDNREKAKNLDSARDANALLETRIANDTLEAHLQSGKPVFENEAARADFVKKYTEQRAAQQQTAAR